MQRGRVVRVEDRGVVAGAASALAAEENFTRKYGARHASEQTVLAIQVAPSGKMLAVLMSPSRLAEDSWNVREHQFHTFFPESISPKSHPPPRFFPLPASWSGHGHIAWLLPQVSPVASTYALSRSPMSSHAPRCTPHTLQKQL